MIITTTKLVHGGQSLGHDENGRKTFVWGALPAEKVRIRLIKHKKSWAEGVVEEVLEASTDRIQPAEKDIFLSTSPWQIMSYKAENEWKQKILEEVFQSESINVGWNTFWHHKNRFGYRNKMEYAFWYEEGSGLSLALHARGSHQKICVKGSQLAMDSINNAGERIISFLNQHKVGGYQLKSVIIRSDKKGRPVLVLYVKDKDLARVDWEQLGLPIMVYYSNPKSPASVETELLAVSGIVWLTDEVAGKEFTYSAAGFFQVNIDAYQEVITTMRKLINHSAPLVDMYSGVGSIGLSLADSAQECTLVEVDALSVEQARKNAGPNCKVVHAKSEEALNYITNDAVIVLDPPRAGLHNDVIEAITREKPPQILYLSCNPATQARDVAKLLDGYTIEYAQGFNFFPATPHIESLLMLCRR